MTEVEFLELVTRNAKAITLQEYPNISPLDYDWAIPSQIHANIRQYAAAYARKGEDLSIRK